MRCGGWGGHAISNVSKFQVRERGRDERQYVCVKGVWVCECVNTHMDRERVREKRKFEVRE